MACLLCVLWLHLLGHAKDADARLRSLVITPLCQVTLMKMTGEVMTSKGKAGTWYAEAEGANPRPSPGPNPNPLAL